MIRKTFYIARGNMSKGYQVFETSPIKIFSTRDASVCWSGGPGEKGRLKVCFYALERFLSILELPLGLCMAIEIEERGDFASIKVLRRDFPCETVFTDGMSKTR